MKKYLKYIGGVIVVCAAVVLYAMYGTSNDAPGLQSVETLNQVSRNTAQELSEQEQYNQIKGEYLDLIGTKGPQSALDLVAARIDDDEFLLNHCHALVHEIGHAAYKQYNDLDLALRYQDGVCNSGYLHGVIEEYFVGTTDVLTAMKTMCIGRDEGRCYHGMGHGLMYYTNNELNESLDYCLQLSGGNPKAYCSQGVFMENFNTDLKLHPSKFLKVEDPSYPCAEQRELFKRGCYYYAPTFFLAQHDNDYTAALAWCRTLEQGYQSVCTGGVAGLAIKFSITNPKKVENMCMSGSSQQLAACIDGMTGFYMNHFDSVAKGRELCTMLEERNQRACRAGVESRKMIFME